MQDTSKLSKKDFQLVEAAKKHIREMFNDELTTIAGALITKSGKIYTGINLKYRARNVSMCAERIALYQALNEKEIPDTVVGVKYFPETDSYEIQNSCGECRQVYLYNDLKVITDVDGNAQVVDIKELLPYSYL
jgi:cytidine deaminase